MAEESRLGYSRKMQDGDLYYTNGKRSVGVTTTRDRKRMVIAFETKSMLSGKPKHYDWLYLTREQAGNLGSYILNLTKKLE